MRAHPTRAGGSTRLSLEMLEDRTLLSATTPTPVLGTALSAAVQQSAGVGQFAQHRGCPTVCKPNR
jgi:hypothetical protein